MSNDKIYEGWVHTGRALSRRTDRTLLHGILINRSFCADDLNTQGDFHERASTLLRASLTYILITNCFRQAQSFFCKKRLKLIWSPPWRWSLATVSGKFSAIPFPIYGFRCGFFSYLLFFMVSHRTIGKTDRLTLHLARLHPGRSSISHAGF